MISLVLACGSQKTADPANPSQVDETLQASQTPPPVKKPAFSYPTARREDQVDDYHGTKVSDPYRWLEDPDSNETAEWVAKENHLTNAYLEKIPHRAPLRKRLTELWNYERYTTPYKRAGTYFWRKNDGLQQQSVVYMSKSMTAEPKVVFDPNTWSKDGTIALAGMTVSNKGRHIAYGVANAGSDWRTWKVRDVKTGKDTTDSLDWLRGSSVSWTKDDKGFYYGRFPEPEAGKVKTAANTNYKLYYHQLGTLQSEDRLVHATPEHPKWGFSGIVSEDGRYLQIHTWKGTGEVNLLHVRDLRTKKTMSVIPDWIGEFSVLGNDGPKFYVKTNYKAPRGRVIAIDLRRVGEKNWKELVAESEDTIQDAALVGNTLMVETMHHATSKVTRYNLRGKSRGEIALPGIGTASGFEGRRDSKETFYGYQSFTEPYTIYRYDLKTNKSSVLRKPNVKFDGSKFETRQVFFASKDGTKVPMFITAKKGLALDGNNPTVLYGYGGFSIAITPSFKVARAVWLEMGGVWVVANIRGGAEYGEEWHEAGIRTKKQNVFDDFIGAAEALIEQKVTSSKKLGIMGRSNGGLLVGAVLNQRPDLFAAAIPAVGVMDMLRFHKFTIGWGWVDDYGSSDNADEFKALHAYSPYHNVRSDAPYPSVLVTTADHDDRVVPGHSFKYAAALQHAHRGDNPILIRIETNAGHSAGTPTSKRIEEATDVYGFLMKNLGMAVPSAE